jgi:hypothetical protein
MKKITLILLAIINQAIVFAQAKTENVAFTVAEFRAGYGVTQFGKGLKERYEAGNFSSSSGGLATLSAYRKFKKINYLNFGIKFKSLGAGPANGDNDQEMFFNYWGSAVGLKYFPLDRNAKKGLYLQGDYFFVTQFTQKYRNTSNLVFDHQFAIGSGLNFGLGYDFAFGKKSKQLYTIGVEYESDSRTGETQNIGSKNFKSSNLGVMIGIKF